MHIHTFVAKMIKIFTMVKDEGDIIRDWIMYHGELVGYENIFVIDNYSTDGTYETLLEFENQIHLSREKDYKLKGEFMTRLIKQNCKPDDFAFPMDSDEFVVYYDKANNDFSVDKSRIINCVQDLPPAEIYKMNYVCSTIDANSPTGYSRATVESTRGVYLDCGKMAKSFFNLTNYASGWVDHGNHIAYGSHHVTNLCLIHYHCRNLEQMKKKVLNNVSGFGYPTELNELKTLLLNNPCCSGSHHVKFLIRILENDLSFLHMFCCDPNVHIKLDDFAELIVKIVKN